MSLWVQFNYTRVKRFPDGRHIGFSEDPVLWRGGLARELPQHSSRVPRVLENALKGVRNLTQLNLQYTR